MATRRGPAVLTRKAADRLSGSTSFRDRSGAKNPCLCRIPDATITISKALFSAPIASAAAATVFSFSRSMVEANIFGLLNWGLVLEKA